VRRPSHDQVPKRFGESSRTTLRKGGGGGKERANGLARAKETKEGNTVDKEDTWR